MQYELGDKRKHPEWAPTDFWGEEIVVPSPGPIEERRWHRGWIDVHVEERTLDDIFSYFQAQLSEIRAELEVMKQTWSELESGKLTAVETEPLVVPDFSPQEVEACKSKILAELSEDREVYPTDIAEKYDLDLRLVLLALQKLLKEGEITEAKASPK